MVRSRNRTRTHQSQVVVPVAALALALAMAATPLQAASYQVFGKVYSAGMVEQVESIPTNPLTGRSASEIVGAEGHYALTTRSMVRVRLLEAASGSMIGSEHLALHDGGYLVSFEDPAASLDIRFEVRDAVTNQQLWLSDTVSVGAGPSLRLLLTLGEPSEIGGTIPFPAAAGTFLFTRVGKVEVSEIDTNGRADVSDAVHEDLKIPKYQDAPFGGNLFLFGAFSQMYYTSFGSGGYCYKVEVDGVPRTDPLHKVRYVYNSMTGRVNAHREPVGPVDLGAVTDCYKLTPVASGSTVFWSFPDLVYLWPTGSLVGAKTVTVKLYEQSDPGTLLATGSLTLDLDNSPLEVAFDDIEQRFPSGALQTDLLANACDIVQLTGGRDLFLRYTARHPNGFLKSYSLRRVSNDPADNAAAFTDWASGAYSPGVPGAPLFHGTAMGGDTITKDSTAFQKNCAYTFRLHAVGRATDGYHRIRRAHRLKAYYVMP